MIVSGTCFALFQSEMVKYYAKKFPLGHGSVEFCCRCHGLQFRRQRTSSLQSLQCVGSGRGDKILYQRIPTPRALPRVVLKNVWQVQHDKQSSNEQSCAEGDFSKIDLHVQAVPHNAVLEDQGRVTKIQDLVHTLRTQSRTESVIADLNKTREFNTFSE